MRTSDIAIAVGFESCLMTVRERDMRLSRSFGHARTKSPDYDVPNRGMIDEAYGNCGKP
ncbi:MAG: hypothetical protein JSW61_08455 [Candidatus Thorarchaeota archaeon]|nr:MAG: hypothetical protein JSW61_08455 [Candidatus Thorarchaeota archaeon]